MAGGADSGTCAKEHLLSPRSKLREEATMEGTRLLRAVARPPYRTALIVVAIAATMGAFFATSYSLALGRETPHEIPMALVGSEGGSPELVAALERGVSGQLAFRPYASARAAEAAIGEQKEYAALVLEPGRPRLLVASASGVSVAQVLEDAAEGVVSRSGVPELEVVDLHPLPPSDPQGLVGFYVTFVASIVGFFSAFQLVTNAKGLSLRAWLAVVLLLAVVGGLLLALATDPIIGALEGSFAELWAAVGAEIAVAALFASTMVVLIGRWAVLPTFTLFVILGSASSGGAVAPPLLPRFYELIGRFLPPGATVETLRSAVYFPDAQHWEPIVTMTIWLVGALTGLLVSSRLRGRVPAG